MFKGPFEVTLMLTINPFIFFRNETTALCSMARRTKACRVTTGSKSKPERDVPGLRDTSPLGITAWQLISGEKQIHVFIFHTHAR